MKLTFHDGRCCIEGDGDTRMLDREMTRRLLRALYADGKMDPTGMAATVRWYFNRATRDQHTAPPLPAGFDPATDDPRRAAKENGQ